MNPRKVLHNPPWIWLACLLFGTMLTACTPGSGNGLDSNGQPLDGAAPPPAADDLFAQVQGVFDARCTVCHAGASAPEGLVLSSGQSYAQLVNITSSQQSGVLRVSPGNPEASYLVRKIRGDVGITGAQMPRNGPPFLSAQQIETVIAWISAGAPPLQAPPAPTEFDAQVGDFSLYRNWQAVDYSIGLTNPTLAGLHGSDAERFSRRVFANQTALNSSGDTFATGSILVKEVFSYDTGHKVFAEEGGLLAMVKRSGDFNPDHGDWEWFMLASDASSIMARGANLMDGGCNACHQQAALDDDSRFGGRDYVFAHQSEFVATNATFADYQSWPLIDDRNDLNPLLDNMAHGATLAGSSRRVYKKQLHANPDTVAQGHPIGTVLVKEVVQAGAVVEATAMVKRGSDFNPDHGNWEWFMLNPNTGAIAEDGSGTPQRGASLMDGMCNGCHFAANPERGEGMDYVFKHSGDPFNNNEEFFAELAAFTDYRNWPMIDYSIGASNPALGGGHEGLIDRYSRKVYANASAMSFEGSTYAKGSVLVKEITTFETGSETFPPSLGLVAMAKRGGNFNPDHAGWEWFELNPDLSQIIGRGADYMNNGCNSCHQLANTGAGADYVFEHPSEFIANNEDFSGYENWLLIDERSDNNPLLGGMAHGAMEPGSVRKVYKKQAWARALDNRPGYPVGTLMVKETSLAGNVIEITAMAKRRAPSETNPNGWEWFMLDTVDQTIDVDENGNPKRGFDLMDGMCTSCHTLAHDESGTGQDYVFPHVNDPFTLAP